MSTTSRALYLPLSAATSVAGGLLASALFGVIWKRVSSDEPAPPNPKDLNRSGGAVLVGAGLQGLVFGVVKAAVDRVGARGYQAITDEPAPQTAPLGVGLGDSRPLVIDTRGVASVQRGRGQKLSR